MTYRERQLRKAERLRGWGEKRQQDSVPMYEAAREQLSLIPLGEPVHDAADRRRREKMCSAVERAWEHGAKGEQMVARADGIERAAEKSIYSDDPDAIERLEIKLRTLEQQRSDAKSYNAACRKAAKRGEPFAPELEGAPAWIRREVATLARIRHLKPGGGLPSYVTTNLTGNITRTRQRLDGLKREREHGPADRIILARFDSQCATCGAALKRGEAIRYNRQDGARCTECES